MKVPQSTFKCLLGSLFLVATVPQAFAVCTPTGFVKDSINLTAALINPHGPVAGDVDATGCNIGIYYSAGTHGRLEGASVHSANYYGVLNNGAHVDIHDSTVYDIGDTPFTGAQHGVAIYFALGSNSDGDIDGNVIWNYQKGGITVNGPSSANVENNTVIGQGPILYIAQNGIQFGYGALGHISRNLVSANSYTGAQPTDGGGIVLVGGDGYGGAIETGIDVQLNVVVGNDVGVWFSNLDVNDNPVVTPTNNRARFNTIRNNAVENSTSVGLSQTYQAGVSDAGDEDAIVGNSICGIGYTPVTPPPFLYAVRRNRHQQPLRQEQHHLQHQHPGNRASHSRENESRSPLVNTNSGCPILAAFLFLRLGWGGLRMALDP